MTPMMDWDRVRVFHAVAQAGSFTRAAEGLGLSQSAISRQIGALEEDLGTAALPSPCTRAGAYRAGRDPAAHGQRGRQAHGVGADRARREPGIRRPVTCASTRRSAWARSGWSAQLPDFVERHPDITDLAGHRRQRRRPQHAGSRRRHSGGTAHAARPDPAPADDGAHAHLRRASLSRAARHPGHVEELDQHRLIAYGDEPQRCRCRV